MTTLLMRVTLTAPKFPLSNPFQDFSSCFRSLCDIKTSRTLKSVLQHLLFLLQAQMHLSPTEGMAMKSGETNLDGRTFHSGAVDKPNPSKYIRQAQSTAIANAQPCKARCRSPR